jgi:hypothetical protein
MPIKTQVKNMTSSSLQQTQYPPAVLTELHLQHLAQVVQGLTREQVTRASGYLAGLSKVMAPGDRYRVSMQISVFRMPPESGVPGLSKKPGGLIPESSHNVLNLADANSLTRVNRCNPLQATLLDSRRITTDIES